MAEAANGAYRRSIRLMNGAVIKENLVISESKSGGKISEEAICEALSRILESAMFIQPDWLRGVGATVTQMLGTAWMQACHSGVRPIA